MARKFDPAFRVKIIAKCGEHGVPLVLAESAMRQWEAGNPPPPCIEEEKGKPKGLASDCRCIGCRVRQCFAFFDQITVNLRNHRGSRR